MSKSNVLENEWLLLYFNNTAAAGIGDASGLQPSGTAGSIHVALHTAWPGEDGDQSTSEATVGAYARQAVARSAGGWTVSGNQASNTAAITWDEITSGSETAFFATLGDDSAGAGNIRYTVPLGTQLGPFLGDADNSITRKGHGLQEDDRVAFFSIPGATLPAGITEGQVYFVLTVPDADNITISATSGGAVIDITADGAGVMWQMTPRPLTTGVTPEFQASQLVVIED